MQTATPSLESIPQTLLQLLRDRAHTFGERVAVMAPGRPPLTYGCLLGHVEATVEALRATGLSRHDRVAVVLPNGPEMAVAFVAVATAATCAPLNPAYRDGEFDFYLSDLKASALIISSEMKSPARNVAEQLGIPVVELTSHDSAGVFSLRRVSNGGRVPSCSEAACLPKPEDTALVLHTSGTTSRPKMVPLTHANICSSGRHISRTLELDEHDRCLNIMPLFHIHGLIAGVVASLTAGGSVVCAPGFDEKRFFEWMDAYAPSWYTAVPTMHHAIVRRSEASRDIIARRPLRFIRSCSAPLPQQLLMELERAFKTRVIESYGMTEASHQMTSNPLAPLPRKLGSVGMAAGPDVAIMDEEGTLLPAGAVGEVVIRGANVTAGYEDNAAANQGAFTNGWFRTGDQGRLDSDGYLYLTGRLKEIINRGGEKIAPNEVDDVLMQHPTVSLATTFAVPHPTLGDDVAAAVVLKPHAQVAEADIIDFAAARLADFKVPRQLVFVDDIPKGATGKLQRIGLADRLADQLALRRSANYVIPETALEKQLSDIWRELLNVDQVGVRDSFYAIGGDSLATAVMVSEVEGRFQTSVSLDAFLKSPTIETLATLVRSNGTSAGQTSAAAVSSLDSTAIRDSVLVGLKNRFLQYLALYIPGYTSTRVWLHRMRGVSIGRNVSIGLSALIETAYPQLVHIGDNVSIGMRAIIIGHLRDSTSEARARRHQTVRIEDHAYIGPGVIILPNVTIGEGAVVAAGSVVSRSIPARTLARGNPAVPIARCGVSLGGGVSYEEFVRNLRPIKDDQAS